MSDWKIIAHLNILINQINAHTANKIRLMLGNHLMQHMGELDNNWIRMYVIDQEVPKILLSLRRPIKSLVNR